MAAGSWQSRQALLDARARGGIVPYWEITATWFAGQLVLLGAGTSGRARNCLAVWREPHFSGEVRELLRV